VSQDELARRDRQLDALQRALGGWFTVRSAGVVRSARTRFSHFNVLDERAKTVVRLTLAHPASASSSAEFEPERARLKLTSLRGYADEYEKVEELLPAAGFNLPGISAKVEVPMRPQERSDVAVSRVLRRLSEVQDANLPGALADIDSEFLHDFRVAVRRTRSVLREMGGVFHPGELARRREEFKWLQDQTSQSRDLDVYLDEFEELRALAPESMRAALEPLRELLAQRRRDAHARTERALTSQRANDLREQWRDRLQVLMVESELERPDATVPIVELVARRVRKVHHRMVKMGREIEPDSPAEQYHALRKRGKELRYLLELFATPLFEPDVVKPMVRALKGLQDVLGHHQDREVQIHMLRELADELISSPHGANTLMAVGVLIERLESDAQHARDSFASSFASFASPAQCKLVSETFAP
jgi:CHAD domain-containing protein